MKMVACKHHYARRKARAFAWPALITPACCSSLLQPHPFRGSWGWYEWAQNPLAWLLSQTSPCIFAPLAPSKCKVHT